MAQIIADRVLETTTTTSTGPLTLDGAVAGYQTFGAVCANGDICYYAVWAVDGGGQPTGDWECGLGTWGTGGILTRTTVHAGTAGPSAVAFAAGTKRVALTATASYMNGVPFMLKRTVYTTSSGTHVYHPNAKRAKVTLVGGGGGGGGGGSAWNGQWGGCGGGGAQTISTWINHLVDTLYAVGGAGTAGAGGTAYSAGVSGGNTTFGGLCAFGGKGGYQTEDAQYSYGGGIVDPYLNAGYLGRRDISNAISTPGGGGGGALTQGSGKAGNAAGNPYPNFGFGSSHNMGGGGTSVAYTHPNGYTGSGGGSSVLGAGGNGGRHIGSGAVAGAAGSGYGAGGGGGSSGWQTGTESGASGGAGSGGVIIIEEFT